MCIKSVCFSVLAVRLAIGFFAPWPLNSAAAFTEKTLYDFCSEKKCADGSKPYGALVMDSVGNLYGTTPVTGPNVFNGVVFELAAGTNQYSVLYKFCSLSNCADGKSPYRVQLVIDTAGNLYGTTEYGGNIHDAGVVFELRKKGSGWKETVLHSFCANIKNNCRDGGSPYDGLTYGGAAQGQPYDGKSPLYGTTLHGGTGSDGGVVYAIAPITGTKRWKETVLYSFCVQSNCTDGEYPETPLYVDQSGNIFGVAGGGQFGAGTVFELSPNGTTYTEAVLYSFCAQTNCTDGKGPDGGVIMDSSGNLFGKTVYGGNTAGDGVLFELSPDAQWQYSVLAEFNGEDGSHPAGMLLDTNGNLIGTTSAGGANRKGTVFEFNGSIQTLYDFCSQANCGKDPIGGVIQDGAGNLYGTTSSGGKDRNYGIVYELSP